jgi:hypothetical protein
MPPASRIKQITTVDPGTIHPKFHLIRPPAQGQTGNNPMPIQTLSLAG